MTLIQRKFIIGCIRCGDFMAFNYAPGDKAMPEGNLVLIFERFSKHQNLKRGHLLRFREKKVPVPGT